MTQRAPAGSARGGAGSAPGPVVGRQGVGTARPSAFTASSAARPAVGRGLLEDLRRTARPGSSFSGTTSIGVVVQVDLQPEVAGRLVGGVDDLGEDLVADRVDQAAADLEPGDADVAGLPARRRRARRRPAWPASAASSKPPSVTTTIDLVPPSLGLGERAGGPARRPRYGSGRRSGGICVEGLAERPLVAGQPADDLRLGARGDDRQLVAEPQAVDEPAAPRPSPSPAGSAARRRWRSCSPSCRRPGPAAGPRASASGRSARPGRATSSSEERELHAGARGGAGAAARATAASSPRRSAARRGRSRPAPG